MKSSTVRQLFLRAETQPAATRSNPLGFCSKGGVAVSPWVEIKAKSPRIRNPVASCPFPMPLRSATEFPITPDPEALESTYQDCRAALVSANRSRGILKAQSDRRGVVITELQRELVELEADLADEARAKARLHALNAKLGSVIRELEETGDAMVGLIDESERQSGFWLVEMFRRLIEQATRWRTVKAKAAALAAEAAEESSDLLEPARRAAMSAGPVDRRSAGADQPGTGGHRCPGVPPDGRPSAALQCCTPDPPRSPSRRNNSSPHSPAGEGELPEAICGQPQTAVQGAWDQGLLQAPEGCTCQGS